MNSGVRDFFTARLKNSGAPKQRPWEGKRAFVKEVLDFLKEKSLVKDWRFTGSGERHDYTIQMPMERQQ